MVSRIKTECILTGDFNLDLLKADSHLGSESLINSLYSHSFNPLITRPTRFGTTSSTLIDNIFTNKPQNLLISGLLIADISDHLPIFYVSKNVTNKCKQNKYITNSYRLMSEKCIADLKLVLINLDWLGLNQLNKANDGYAFFM